MVEFEIKRTKKNFQAKIREIDVMFFFFREVLEEILGFPDIKPRNMSKTSWKKKTSHQFWLESFFSAFNLEFHHNTVLLLVLLSIEVLFF